MFSRFIHVVAWIRASLLQNGQLRVHCMDTAHFVFPFIYPWTRGWFPSFGNNAAMNTCTPPPENLVSRRLRWGLTQPSLDRQVNAVIIIPRLQVRKRRFWEVKNLSQGQGADQVSWDYHSNAEIRPLTPSLGFLHIQHTPTHTFSLTTLLAIEEVSFGLQPSSR